MALHLTTDHSTLCPTPHHRQHDPAECAVPCSRRSCTPTTGRKPSAAPPGPRHSPRTPPIPAPQPWGACPASPRPPTSTAPPLPVALPLHTPARRAPHGVAGGVSRSSRRQVGPRRGCGEGGREGGEAAEHVVCMSSGTLRPPRPLPPLVRMDVAIFHPPFASLTLIFPINSPPPVARHLPPATLALATAAPHTCTPPGTVTPLNPHPRPLAPCSPAAAPGCLPLPFPAGPLPHTCMPLPAPAFPSITCKPLPDFSLSLPVHTCAPPFPPSYLDIHYLSLQIP